MEATNTGTDTQAPSNASTDTAPSADDDSSSGNPVSSLMARLTKRYEAEQKVEQTDQPAGEAPTTEGEKPKDEPEKKPDPKVEPEPEKPKDRLELEHGRALEKNRKLTSDNVALTKRAETAETQLSELRKAGKANPLKVLEQLGEDTFANIMARAGKGEFDEAEASSLPKEVQDKLKLVDEIVKEREAEKKAAARKADFEADLPKVAKLLTDKAEQYPLFAALEDGPHELLAHYYDALDKGEKPSLLGMLEEFERAGTESLTENLGNAKLVRAVLAKNPSIRAVLTEALGLGKPTPTAAAPHAERGSPEPPRSAAPTAEVLSRTAHEQTEEEENAEAARLWRLHTQARAVQHQE